MSIDVYPLISEYSLLVVLRFRVFRFRSTASLGTGRRSVAD
jgi:hypothetical protein